MDPELEKICSDYRLKLIESTATSVSFLKEESFTEETKAELEFILKKNVDIINDSNAEIHHEEAAKNEKQEQHFNLNAILLDALKINASDVHIEAQEKAGRIRYRALGIMITASSVNLNEYPALINQIKIRSDLDIAERRLPQDGRFSMQVDHKNLDIRVSIIPALHGEKAVLRILGNITPPALHALGLSSLQLEQFKTSLERKQGLILISGPTGSGKTTSLYSCLSMLNNSKRNIITVEDPVEISIPGITQVQVKESIGLTFGKAIKAFLRQDPDVIMIGEVRDQETAMIAVRAAMTGHLVLSTIHTNSAADTINRLVDLGVPRFLLASTLTLSVAQRLVRTVCSSCMSSTAGCSRCQYTGFSGRKAFFEVISVDSIIKEKIERGLPIEPQQDIEGHRTIADQLINAIAEGITTQDEISACL